VVFAAGSLILPFQELEAAFEAAYPDIDVRPEYHGSIQVIRHATELHEPIDVVATADASLLPMLMFEAEDPATGAPYASWACGFAGNRLALAYTDRSRYRQEISGENWPEILARPEVLLGLADPRFDASGYRGLMALALAERASGEFGLFNQVFDGQFTYPVRIFREDDLSTITVPEILETSPGSHLRLRGGSIQLLSLLESGDIDYAFEYESVIRQHGLGMMELPAQVNLSVEALRDVYAQAEVELEFQRFASVAPRFVGEPIAYGITIPSNAPHPQQAEAFVAFLLGPEGRAVMEANHHPLLADPQALGWEAMPESIQAMCAGTEEP
jgi:molybdate/tungstate transport system substrate-binding protein